MTKFRHRHPVQTFESAVGTIDYPLTNDFMFHVVLEESDECVLRKLLCSLLHMEPEEIVSIDIRNPIDYGRAAADKKTILDLKLLLNNDTMVNIEMQVLDEKDWPERSVIYLCRSYDNVRKGENYDSLLSAHHISILDYDLFDDEPEFYSTHHLRNDRSGRIYTGNFSLSVLNLRRIELATEEDRKWNIDKWAALFKAQTWEDLRMIATQDKEMTVAAKKLYNKNQDEVARLWAQAHEDFLWEERIRKKRAEKLEKEMAEKEKMIKSMDQEIQSKDQEIQSKDQEIQSKDQEIQSKDQEIQSKDQEIQSKDQEIQSKDQEIDRLRSILAANGINPN
ncbi:MAG: Rpn family recombination-promoting nuclease/putative transposase [Lachnospiraceae bacterium]|nr:Rpn family recombination-promoting nuclease/putative transposase [Lachnospiraceae bacterium]